MYPRSVIHLLPCRDKVDLLAYSAPCKVVNVSNREQSRLIGLLNSLKYKNGQPCQCRNAKLQVTHELKEWTYADYVLWETETLSSCNHNSCCWCRFFLSTWLLTSLGGIFLEVSKLSSGEVSTALSKLPYSGHCVVFVEVSNVSHEDRRFMFKTSRSRAYLSDYVWISDCGGHFIEQLSTGECQIS